MNAPIYDFVLFGASSFVGKIMSQYLLSEQVDGQTFRWAMAGRSEKKLNALKKELGERAAEIPVIIADSFDEAALTSLCQQTKVVASTVGPYDLYGEPLVKICAQSGTHYCDLTGETQWIAEMIEKYQDDAKHSGACIVNCCGFDSMPSDFGVLFLQHHAEKTLGSTCDRVKMRVKAMKGDMSGGTAASIMNIAEKASKDAGLRKKLANPYILCPKGHAFSAYQSENALAKYDSDFDKWQAPFVMATINTRVVHRSNALQDCRYGNNFRYDEAMLCSGRLMAYGITGAMGSFMAASFVPPTRMLLQKFVIPKPGEGPSVKAQEAGFYDLRFQGTTADEQQIKVKVTGDKDPGYGSTGKMLGQAAIYLANVIAQGDYQGGFWTPASLFGIDFVEQLTERAGLTFEVIG